VATPCRRSLPICSLLASSTLGDTEQHSDMPYLVIANTESLEKTFPWHHVICNQQFWLVRSTFRPGDNSNVGACPNMPDPSSSCEGCGSETGRTHGTWRSLRLESSSLAAWRRSCSSNEERPQNVCKRFELDPSPELSSPETAAMSTTVNTWPIMASGARLRTGISRLWTHDK